MLVWLLVLVTVLIVTPALFALAYLAKRLNWQKRQGYARRSAQDILAVDAPAPLTRKKPDWVMHEVLRLKALMGKHAGCRKVADTFNRLHAPTSVGKFFVNDTIRNHLDAPRPVLHMWAEPAIFERVRVPGANIRVIAPRARQMRGSPFATGVDWLPMEERFTFYGGAISFMQPSKSEYEGPLHAYRSLVKSTQRPGEYWLPCAGATG